MQRTRASILLAMASLSQHLDQNWPLSSVIDVLSKPSRKVVMTKDVEKGALILPPESMSVKAGPRDEWALAAEAGCVQVRVTPDDSDVVFWLVPMCTEKLMAPLWAVASTPNDWEANLVWGRYAVTVLSGVDYVGVVPLAEAPPKKRTRKTRKDGDAAEDEAQQLVVSIPVLVNADLLKEGEELRVHRALAAKKQRPAEAITMARLTKMKGSP